ncbi:mediator complex subunit [Artemisia annua]|uniref:Mediator complex subunit n=1 Tax=Artemisia annua TaxID=35608 RepID=A0A2U1MR14_ARTAN|nr:mediator complex subunit [Artemisia annua]
MQHHHHQPNTHQHTGTTLTNPSSAAAPPKQVALAMDRLAQAARLIADIRLGADRLLEALFIAGQQPSPGSTNKPLSMIVQEGACMRQYLHDLRAIDYRDHVVLLDCSIDLTDSLCALALKSFTDQKRRFFPHLDEDSGDEPSAKKHRGTETSTASQQEDFSELRTVLDVLTELEKEVPDVKTFTYERLDWSKRASFLASSSSETLDEPPKDNGFHSSRDIRSGSGGAIAADQIAVIELLLPTVFRAVISLHPTGSLDPDAVAFFSPDEGGSYVHARGVSAFNVFRNITEHAAMAPQHFIGVNAETALYSLLHWICGYQTLFTKVCSKCGKLLSMDKESALLLPPVQRPYRNFSFSKHLSQNLSAKDQSINDIPAYHIGCFPQES